MGTTQDGFVLPQLYTTVLSHRSSSSPSNSILSAGKSKGKNVQKKKSVGAGKAGGKTTKKGRKKKMQDLFEALSSKASPKILADNLLSKYGTAEGENIVVVQLLNLIFRCSGMENNGGPCPDSIISHWLGALDF